MEHSGVFFHFVQSYNIWEILNARFKSDNGLKTFIQRSLRNSLNVINQFHLSLNQRTLILPVLSSRVFTWSKYLNNHSANSVFFVCYFSKSTRTSVVIISSRNSNQLKHDLHFLRTCGCSQAVDFSKGIFIWSHETLLPLMHWYMFSK